jgi:hypothetical protein
MERMPSVPALGERVSGTIIISAQRAKGLLKNHSVVFYHENTKGRKRERSGKEEKYEVVFRNFVLSLLRDKKTF